MMTHPDIPRIKAEIALLEEAIMLAEDMAERHRLDVLLGQLESAVADLEAAE